ncbi:UNVERIFIED_CONTAM: hypothetical protein GTU68_058463 [Idotea baltica]|nr:hypothetical protein [Idotea baltica]
MAKSLSMARSKLASEKSS